MKQIIIGYGQIGKAVHEVIGSEEVYTVDKDHKTNMPSIPDVVHICFPYSETFVKDVKDYKTKYQPRHIIIWSTVAIGTTKQIPGAVHSPVEGKHPNLAKSIRTMNRWVGVNVIGEAEFFYRYFWNLKIDCRVVSGSDATEAIKLLSTAEYGINIVFARYKKSLADKLGVDYQLMKDWNEDYNQLYKNLRLGRKFQKFVLDPPEGPIGGHCVVPNAEILSGQYPDILLKLIMEVE